MLQTHVPPLSQVFFVLTEQLKLIDRDKLRLEYDPPGRALGEIGSGDVSTRTGELNSAPWAGDCGSVLCNQFGFMDQWEVMHTARQAKFYMSICVCLQLLKIIKFTNVIVPKMSLMTAVLAKGKQLPLTLTLPLPRTPPYP